MLKDRVARGFSVIIIARGKAAQADYAVLTKAMQDLLIKADLLLKEE
jgi:RNase P protein component